MNEPVKFGGMSLERIQLLLPEIEANLPTWPWKIPMPTEWQRVMEWVLDERKRLLAENETLRGQLKQEAILEHLDAGGVIG